VNEIVTETVVAEKIADNIVLVVAKEGVEINAINAIQSNHIIEEAMGCNYGMIIDRKNDYSIDPVNVYQLLNTIERLKVIALVLHKKSSMSLVSTEEHLFKGPLKAFTDLDAAIEWTKKQLLNFE